MSADCDPQRPKPNGEETKLVQEDPIAGTLFRMLEYLDGRIDRMHNQTNARIDRLQFWMMVFSFGLMITVGGAVAGIAVTLTNT